MCVCTDNPQHLVILPAKQVFWNLPFGLCGNIFCHRCFSFRFPEMGNYHFNIALPVIEHPLFDRSLSDFESFSYLMHAQTLHKLIKRLFECRVSHM